MIRDTEEIVGTEKVADFEASLLSPLVERVRRGRRDFPVTGFTTDGNLICSHGQKEEEAKAEEDGDKKRRSHLITN